LDFTAPISGATSATTWVSAVFVSEQLLKLKLVANTAIASKYEFLFFMIIKFNFCAYSSDIFKTVFGVPVFVAIFLLT
jgi:hypothetical protein